MVTKYYQKHKENSNKASERYQNLSQEEKDEKRQHQCESNKNLSDVQRSEQVEYMKNYYLAQK